MSIQKWVTCDCCGKRYLHENGEGAWVDWGDYETMLGVVVRSPANHIDLCKTCAEEAKQWLNQWLETN